MLDLMKVLNTGHGHARVYSAVQNYGAARPKTLDDLSWLEQRGFDRDLRRLAEIGIPIAGICGGFQMLGVTVEDPWGIENHGDACRVFAF